ncbi:hypothetical protein ACQP3L_39420, partial [Escherichia coli]
MKQETLAFLLFTFLKVSSIVVCAHMCACLGACVEVRGQFEGVGSSLFPLLCGLRGLLRASPFTR